MVSEQMNRGEKWQEVYHRTVLEVDGKKMPKRIAGARRAMGKRLQALVGDIDRTEERQQIGNALGSLDTLQLEVRSWQLHSDRYRGITLNPEQRFCGEEGSPTVRLVPGIVHASERLRITSAATAVGS